MTWLRLALLPLLAYMVADFASPYVAGVLSFEVASCVDGVRDERLCSSAERAVMRPAPNACAVERPTCEDATAPRHTTAPGRPPATSVRDPRYARSDRGAPADDH